MKIHEYLRKTKPLRGDLGVEIEVEGQRLPSGMDEEGNSTLSNWVVTQDGSLRGGLEYVLKTPLSLGKCETALDELDKAMKDAKSSLDISMRCATHVHVNMQNFTFCQALTFATAYYIMEEAVSLNCGRNRAGNLFALRLVDGYGVIPNFLLPAIHNNNPKYLGSNDIRYAGLNLKALVDKGSIEFRMLGSKSPFKDNVLPWANFLLTLRDESIRRYESPKEIVESFSGDGPARFIEELVGPDLAAQWVFSVDGWEKMCYEGVRIVQDFAYEHQNWPDWCSDPSTKTTSKLSSAWRPLRMAEAFPEIQE